MPDPRHVTPQGLLDTEEVEDRVVLGADAPEPDHYPRGSFRKILWAIATVAVSIVLTYTVPGLGFARPWTPADPVPFWNLVGREWLEEGEKAEVLAEEVARADAIARAVAEREREAPVAERVVKPPPPESEIAKLPVYQAHPDDERLGDLEVPIEDPSAIALQRFYERLAATESGFSGAITRVSHWGDSAIGNDGITAAIRRSMQRRFGDAGHGFHLLQPPNASYRHQNVRFSTNGKWGKCFIIERCRRDGHYGFGGVTFQSAGGAESEFATAKEDSPVGRSVGRFELWYAGQPRGGRIRIRVDDQEPVVLETEAEELVDRWHAIEVKDGPHRFEVRAVGGGRVRAYGVTLERELPGVVWDGLSLIGSFSSRLAAMDTEHFRSQLRHRNTDLVVLMFGGNDMQRSISMERYKEDYGPVLALVRGGDDPPACLVMAPLDHGDRKGRAIVTRPIVPKMVQAQRELAFEHGCAFFDTFAAMGGEGSMGRWMRAGLGSGDLAHLTAKGHRVIGDLLYLALMDGYVRYRRAADGGEPSE